jgi:hypothetical protein
MMMAGFNQSTEQAAAFFTGYANGWKRLHEAMVSDPQIQKLYAVFPVQPRGEPQPFQQAYPLTSQPEKPEAAAPVEELDLNKPLPLDQVHNLLDEAEKKAKGDVQPQGVVNPRVRNMTTPMDPEDIAAAATPVVLGNVMGTE